MKLIDLLVQENFNWPANIIRIHQDHDGQLWGWDALDCAKRLEILTHIADNARQFGKNETSENMVTREQYEAATQQLVWNGEGLPPAGCECEIKRIADWMPVTIKFISHRHTVFTTFGGTEDCYQTCSLHFRPICSESDKKREEAINKIQSHCHVDHHAPISAGQAIALYDAIAAGKIPHIQLK